MKCRACSSTVGDAVLDLGEQPACDHFPALEDSGPDPVYPLQMWLCFACGLAQLVADPTVPEEPRGAEPTALIEQAADAVGRVVAAGWIRAGSRVAEYGSPHGGSWLSQLVAHGASSVGPGDSANAVLDCFGLMHCADQAAAVQERAERVAPGGVMLLQYHSLATIVRHGQWNSLRHGHYAYYSLTALVSMLTGVGFRPRMVWHFDLYGGTVLLAATRETDKSIPADESVTRELEYERALGLRDPASLRMLGDRAKASATALRSWLRRHHASSRSAYGYGAASRAVALLCAAGADRSLLPAIADASPAKQGRRMPGTDIPVIAPAALVAARPESVLLFLPDLLPEVRRALPEIEAAGGRWVNADDIC